MAQSIIPPPPGQEYEKKKNRDKKFQSFVIAKYRDSNDPEIAGLNLPYMKDGPSEGMREVYTEIEFKNFMEKKPHDKNFNWKAVEFVQTCVKDQMGIGKPININFFANIDETSDKTAAQEISYDYKGIADEIVLLQNEQYQEYCMKQCLKMCYYL